MAGIEIDQALLCHFDRTDSGCKSSGEPGMISTMATGFDLRVRLNEDKHRILWMSKDLNLDLEYDSLIDNS